MPDARQCRHAPAQTRRRRVRCARACGGGRQPTWARGTGSRRICPSRPACRRRVRASWPSRSRRPHVRPCERRVAHLRCRRRRGTAGRAGGRARRSAAAARCRSGRSRRSTGPTWRSAAWSRRWMAVRASEPRSGQPRGAAAAGEKLAHKLLASGRWLCSMVRATRERARCLVARGGDAWRAHALNGTGIGHRRRARVTITAMREIVYLVGAGPGAPDLISARGLRCLQAADVVIYDHLVHARLLHFAPAAGRADRRRERGARAVGPGSDLLSHRREGARRQAHRPAEVGRPVRLRSGRRRSAVPARAGHSVRGRARRAGGHRRAGVCGHSRSPIPAAATH